MQLPFLDLGYGGSPSCDSLASLSLGIGMRHICPHVLELGSGSPGGSRFLFVFKVFPGRTVKQLKIKTLLNAPT